jgi:heat shock protein HslJ
MARDRAVIIKVVMAAAFVLLILGIGGGLLLARANQSLPDTVTQHTWQLEAFTFGRHQETLLTRVPITLTFRAQQNQISGFNGCNSYGANYTASYGHLHLDHFYETLVACIPSDLMQQESTYMQALQQVTTYEIGPTSLLTLRDDASQVVLQYSPVPLQGDA